MKCEDVRVMLGGNVSFALDAGGETFHCCKGPHQNSKVGVVMASVVSVVMKNDRLHKQAAVKIRKRKAMQ